MTKELRVKLLGSPAVFVGDKPLRGFVSVKAQALVFYFAATGEVHRRDALAALLWSDTPEAVAKKNLRDVLFNLRHLIGPYLIITRQIAGLNLEAPVAIDSRSLLQTLQDMQGADKAPAPATALQSLTGTAKQGEGAFLDGFYVSGAPLFEEWMLAERERLRLELGAALESLTEYALAAGDYTAAEAYARRQLELDRYRETAHRQLLTVLALSDRRAEAAAHYERLAAFLESELGVEPAQKTQELLAKILAGEMIPPSFAGRPQRPPHNLPRALSPFVGRETELAETTRLLTDEADCRLLTLVGPGGIGKTALGVEAARQLLEAFPHGVWFVSLAPVHDTSLIIPAMGKALNLRFQGAREPKEQLLDHLQPMQALLLLDNFEQLLDEAELLPEILAGAPGVKLLVTSRERLDLRAEWVYEVRGLSYPSVFHVEQVDGVGLMEAFPAIRLFTQYARRANASCAISIDELPHIVHLCQLLDGMPLGLELAASWARSMTIQEITAEVASDLDFLSTTSSDVPERHRSLRALFEQTWQRLSGDEQRALANLSIFHGGCRQEAAAAVAGATPSILSALVEKALLQHSQDGRYGMHEIIRQFGYEQLRHHTTEYECTLDRHSAYYASFLQQVEEDTVGWNMLKTFNLIGEEIDNIFAALDWAIIQKNAAIFEQTAESLVQYWPYPALERQGKAIIERAVAALSGSAERGKGVRYPPLSPNLRPIVGFLMAIEGLFITRIGSLREAQAILEQGIALQDTSNRRHQRRLAKSKYYLGWNLYLQGKHEEAVAVFRETLTLYSEVQYPHGMAWTLFQLGRASYYQRGQFTQAEQFSAKSRNLSDRFGFSEIGGYSRCLQALIAIDKGKYTKAMDLLNRSLDLQRDVGTYMDLAVPLRERGRLYLILGQFARAKVDFDQSMVLSRKHGGDWMNEVNLHFAGDLNRLQGNYAEAEQLYKRSLAAAREVNNQRLTALFLSGLGTIMYDRGEYAEAERLQLEALEIVKRLHNEPVIASILRYLGHVTMALGKKGCQEQYLESLRVAETLRLAPLALDILVGAAQLFTHQGRELDAIELLAMVAAHEASSYETKTNAAKSLEALAANIDGDLYTLCESRGPEQDLWEVTRRLLSKGL